MGERPLGPLTVVAKTIVTHTVTYALVGMLALLLGDYASFYADTDLRFVMRPTTDPILVLAPTLQLLRGSIFGLLFYVLREPFFARPRGWLLLWAVLVGVGILGTFGPTPGSLEGLFFTTYPLAVHLRGLPEVLLQSLLLATLLCYWVNHPERRWLSWLMGLAFVLLAFVFPLLGLLYPGGQR
jgi:hypothetical protein